jgi:hypothetical protein
MKERIRLMTLQQASNEKIDTFSYSNIFREYEEIKIFSFFF